MHVKCMGLSGNLALLGPVAMMRKKFKIDMMMKTATACILNLIPDWRSRIIIAPYISKWNPDITILDITISPV